MILAHGYDAASDFFRALIQVKPFPHSSFRPSLLQISSIHPPTQSPYQYLLSRNPTSLTPQHEVSAVVGVTVLFREETLLTHCYRVYTRLVGAQFLWHIW